MPRLNLTIVALLVSAMAACEHDPNATALAPRPGGPLRAEQPDAAFRLTEAQRARLLSMYDAEAVERLLQMVRPDARDSMLRSPASLQLRPWRMGAGRNARSSF